MKMTKCFIGLALLFTSITVWADASPPPDQTVLQQVGVNDAIQTQVAELIKKSVSAAEKTGEFLQKELPDMVKQFLTWHFWKATVLFSMWSLFFLVMFCYGISCIYTSQTRKFNYYSEKESVLVRGIMFLLFSGFPFIGVMVCGLNALQIMVAPKVYLIEWAAQQVQR